MIVYTKTEMTIEEFMRTMEYFSDMTPDTLYYTNFNEFYDKYKLFIASLNFNAFKQVFVGKGYNQFTAAKKAAELMKSSAEFFVQKICLEEHTKGR